MSAVLQGTDEWFAARRDGVSSTDIPAILGISPWKSEGDVAREKAGQTIEYDDASARRMRLGTFLEDAVAAEEVVEHGFRLRRVRRLLRHPRWAWAVTSLDFERVGQRTIVEVKTTASRDWRDGLPDYVEAQVRWQMGVAGYPNAHVAALRWGQTLDCYDLVHDESLFDALIRIAGDFRRRLAVGGPFGETHASVRRAWPVDDGQTMVADQTTIERVFDLISTKRTLAVYQQQREDLETAIQTTMGAASVLRGPGFVVTYKQARPTERTDWRLVSEGALRAMGDDAANALVSLYTTSEPGSRRFHIHEENA